MKLDRNINGNGRGKYALLKLRMLDDYTEQSAFGQLAKPIADAIKTLEEAGILDWGVPETEAEFFVVRLRDRYAHTALFNYAQHAERDGQKEYAADIYGLARRAGRLSQFCKTPD